MFAHKKLSMAKRTHRYVDNIKSDSFKRAGIGPRYKRVQQLYKLILFFKLAAHGNNKKRPDEEKCNGAEKENTYDFFIYSKRLV